MSRSQKQFAFELLGTQSSRVGAIITTLGASGSEINPVSQIGAKRWYAKLKQLVITFSGLKCFLTNRMTTITPFTPCN